MISGTHGTRRTITAVVVIAAITVLLASGCSEQESGGGKPRVLMFAVDAANWNVVTPMLENGELPNIAKLVREGSYGILTSGEPIQSPQMWTSVATGVVPERHGILGFVAEVPGTDNELPVTNNMRRVKAFWNVLTEEGVSVGIVGWWPSWPVDKVKGFMIAQRAWPMNWSLHGIPFGAARDRNGRLITQEFPGRTYPEDLYNEFEQFVMTEEDVSLVDLNRFFADSRFTDPRRQFHARWVYAKDRTFADAGLHFYGQESPEVFAVYLQGTDVVSHYYWGYQTNEGFTVSPEDERLYGRVVRNYYAFVDETIGRYLEIAPPGTAVLIVSDHGFETKRDLKVRWERGEAIRTVEGGKDVPWDHGMDGLIIFAGPGIRKGHRLDGLSVVDVTPTLMAYLGAPVAEDLDGGPAIDLFEDDYAAAHPVQWVATYETGESRGDDTPLASPMDEGIKEKLRSLGYIE
ncbi:alkaline phosphatase family protein [bacterium]|nr:alkaline phosphatase family protein [bacterium]